MGNKCPTLVQSMPDACSVHARRLFSRCPSLVHWVPTWRARQTTWWALTERLMWFYSSSSLSIFLLIHSLYWHSLHTGRDGAKVFELYSWNYPIRPEGAGWYKVTYYTGAHISSTPWRGKTYEILVVQSYVLQKHLSRVHLKKSKNVFFVFATW